MPLAFGGGLCCLSLFFVQAEDGIRDLVRSRGLGDVYKRQALGGDDPVVLVEDARVLRDRIERDAQGAERLAVHLSLIHI